MHGSRSAATRQQSGDRRGQSSSGLTLTWDGEWKTRERGRGPGGGGVGGCCFVDAFWKWEGFFSYQKLSYIKVKCLRMCEILGVWLKSVNIFFKLE